MSGGLCPKKPFFSKFWNFAETWELADSSSEMEKIVRLLIGPRILPKVSFTWTFFSQIIPF